MRDGACTSLSSLLCFFIVLSSLSFVTPPVSSSVATCTSRVAFFEEPSSVTVAAGSSSNCSVEVCSWNRAWTWCLVNLSDATTWEFQLEGGIYSYSIEHPPLPLHLPLGVERIVIRSLAMDPPVVWSGSYSRMSVQSKGSHVQMEVIGITFSRNASLVLTAPSNESASPRVVVDGCNFVSAQDIRPLRIISGGHILVNRSNFVGNLNGGAGEMQGNAATVSIHECVVIDNIIMHGSGAGLLINGSSSNVNIYRSSFFNNSAKGIPGNEYPCSGFQGGCGGGGLAVYSLGTVVVQNSSFVGNSALYLNGTQGRSGGGGMWVYASSIQVNYSEFVGNEARGNGKRASGSNGGGGAWIYAMNRGVMVDHVDGFSNMAFLNGIGGPQNFNSPGNGGGCFWIYSFNESVSVLEGRFEGNRAVENGAGENNLPENSGNGGSNNGGGAIWIWTSHSGGLIAVRGGTFSNNNALGNGQGGSGNLEDGNGGSLNGGGALWLNSMEADTIISDLVVRSNKATGNGQGGGNNGSSGSGNGNGGSFNGGGGIWTYPTGYSVVSNCFMSENVASKNGQGGPDNAFQSVGGNNNGGGALYAASALRLWSFESKNNQFYFNYAVENGMGGNESDSTATLASGGSLCGGGAAFLINTAIHDSEFVGNHGLNSGVVFSPDSIGADGTNNGGGAVLAQSSRISECYFFNNSMRARKLSPSGNGGALRLVSSSVVDRSRFQKNHASFQGGAIASGSGDNQVTSSIFDQNSSIFQGGAMIVDNPSVFLPVSNSEFMGNSALFSRGGAIAVVANLATISTRNCSFVSNYAAGEGGAVAVIVEGGSFLSDFDHYVENSAETFGGVFYSGSGSRPSSDPSEDIAPASITVKYAGFRNNSAGFGGVFMTDNQGVATVSSSHAVGNYASTVAGGFAHLMVRSELSITSSNLDRNFAAVSAGAIYQEHFSIFRMSYSVCQNSRAPLAGALQSRHDSSTIITNSTYFLQNMASQQDSGAIYVAGSSSVQISQSFFFNNSAVLSGGAIAMYDSARVSLNQSFLIFNHAKTSGGGGFSLSFSSALKMYGGGCESNIAHGGAGGCGLIGDRSRLDADSVLFGRNSVSRGDGGALSFGSASDFSLISSRFEGNKAWRGGALSFNSSLLWISNSSVPVLRTSLRNCLFKGNKAVPPSSVEMQNNLVGLLAPGGGGSIFFNLPGRSRLTRASSVWLEWRKNNVFESNSAVYGSLVSSIGVTPFFSMLSTRSSMRLTPCQNIATFDPEYRIAGSQDLLQTMPGVPLSISVGVCDAFGHAVTSLRGGPLLYSWNQTSSPSQIVRTSNSNGTAEIRPNLPVVSVVGSWITLRTQYSGINSISLPTLSLSWQSTLCAPFYGFDENRGCSLCSPSQYSISPSLGECLPCEKLSVGADCVSLSLESLMGNIEDISNISIPDSSSSIVTTVKVMNGYWPAVSGNLHSTTGNIVVVPVSCPFRYCSRHSAPLYVTGVDSSTSLARVSDLKSVCEENSFRNPLSPLCGECIKGYASWNYACNSCPHGPNPGYIFLFIFFLFVWTFVQLILAQQGGSGSATAMLFFLTQSLSWFTYPQGILQAFEGLVNFHFDLPSSGNCYIDVDGSIELFLRALVPTFYFVALWILYLIHISIAWCLSRRFDIRAKIDPQSFPEKEGGKWKKFIENLRNFILFSSTTDPYIRTTALLLLSTYPSLLDSIFSVWSCVDVPMGSQVLSLVALTPTVRCGTETYWLWNIFYISLLVLLLSVIVFVGYSTTKARNEKINPLVPVLPSNHRLGSDLRVLPSNLPTKFGSIWREAFLDRVPWWTMVELLVRLLLIAVFALTVTRVQKYTNFLLGIGIIGWIFAHNYFSPFREKQINRLVVLTQYSMLVMALAAATGTPEDNTQIMIVLIVYGICASILGVHIVWKLVISIRDLFFSHYMERRASIRQSEISQTLLAPVHAFMHDL